MNRRALNAVILALSALRLIPHCGVLLWGRSRADMLADIQRWASISLKRNSAENPVISFIKLMTFFPEFRNLFYFRAGLTGRLLAPLCPPMSALLISADSIGPGLFIQHGIATIIAAKSIGANCWINQQVTIGFSTTNDRPTIGDNVMINAGAKVIGNVTVGNNSKIGANAVVVKDVPPDVTVVGVPARIVRRRGLRVDAGL